MLLILFKTTGWLAAQTPEALLRGLCAVLGDLIFFCLPRRHRLVRSNLHHAFPERPSGWHLAIGRESCRRVVETGLLSLATPFLSEQRLRRIVAASPELKELYAEHAREPAATLICSPHIAYWEVQTAKPLIIHGKFPEFGIIFRPLDNTAANDFVTASRERFGMKLLSRKEGFVEALKILRRRGFVGVLFDQNAGLQGALTTLFGRVCATTELPGLMAEKFNARVYGIFPRRLGFWRVEIDAHRITHDGTGPAVTFGLNRWLETLLRSDDNLCASWLWAHDRWRHQDMPAKRLRLEAKRNLLAAELAVRDLDQLPRRTRIWVRLPNWLGDVMMALPLLRALREARPDAEITLVGKAIFLPVLETWGVADRLHALPERGIGYYTHFRALRTAFPDVWLLFTNSWRGDLEAWLSGCPQRFGIVRQRKPRPLLSHAYRLPPSFDEQGHHQVKLWEDFLRHFGLLIAPNFTPFSTQRTAAEKKRPIALIPGSENNPEKRWPVHHWRALIDALPEETFSLFGTRGDGAITERIATGFSADRINNRAGKTDLESFARELAGCRALVTNDTGGMHLANAMGIPLLGLFGPTNPVRTGPVFAGSTRILQPPGCPPRGGWSLAALPPESVASALRQVLAAPESSLHSRLTVP